MASEKMKYSARVQTQRLLQRFGADKDAVEDEVFADMEDRYKAMVSDLNKLGDGLAESLAQTKKLFSTNNRLAEVLDHFYNGELAHRWPEVNSDATMKQHDAALEFKVIWDESNTKYRSSAAFINIRLAMNQLRAFMGGVKEVKAKNRQRNEAELEFNSRRRELRKAERKNPKGKNVGALRVSCEMALERSKVLTEQQKDQLVKEKIARDSVVDEYTISTIICQAEIFGQLSKDLNDLVEKLPQDKVSKVRSQIRDLVQLGGPRIASDGPSGLRMAANVALGVQTLKEYKESELKKHEMDDADAERRRLKAIEIAEAEERVRSGSRVQGSGFPQAPKFQVSRLPTQHTSQITRLRTMPPPPGPSAATLSPSPEPAGAEEPREILVAEFAHDVEADEDLEFTEGDHIVVIAKDPSGWNTGKNLRTGKTGMFPVNYTRPLSSGQEAQGAL